MSATDIDAIRTRVSYDPITGEFTRLISSGGSTAGSVINSKPSKNGYIYVAVFDSKILAHRLAWALSHGEWPPHDVDHIDGVRSNNRLSNLRPATRSENMQNARKARASNKSCGLLGVSWSKAANRWSASIKTNGKAMYLGLFDCPKQAHEAYIQAKRELHPYSTI